MLTGEEKEGLGIAFNEATVHGAELDAESRMAAITLSVLTLPEHGDPPDDPRVQVLLSNVGRAAASLRLGNWNDAAARVVRFPPEELLRVVQEFGGCAIYGEEFFDLHEAELAKWNGRFSFDVSWSETGGRRHSFRLFQEGYERHLDVLIWFDELRLRDPAGNELSISDVIAGGRRWWKAFYAHDPRTQGNGVVPLQPWDEE